MEWCVPRLLYSVTTSDNFHWQCDLKYSVDFSGHWQHRWFDIFSNFHWQQRSEILPIYPRRFLINFLIFIDFLIFRFFNKFSDIFMIFHIFFEIFLYFYILFKILSHLMTYFDFIYMFIHSLKVTDNNDFLYIQWKYHLYIQWQWQLLKVL